MPGNFFNPAPHTALNHPKPRGLQNLRTAVSSHPRSEAPSCWAKASSERGGCHWSMYIQEFKKMWGQNVLLFFWGGQIIYADYSSRD